MAIDDHILCASNFGSGIDGTYNLLRIDKYGLASSNYVWTNGTYYIFKDSFYWMISDSDTMYWSGHLKAKKPYIEGSSPAGHYIFVNDDLSSSSSSEMSGDNGGDVVIGSC